MSSPIFCKVEEAASIFSDIRNYLAGRVIGITRDSALLHEVVKCLFCSLSLKDSLSGESSAVDVSEAYRREFRLIKNKLTFAFDPDEEILLDPQTILYVHQKLIKIDYYTSEKDIFSELYQCFISSDLRQNDGQFFTPFEAIKFLVEAINPEDNEKIIDPSCGTGGFLSYASRFLLNKNIDRESIHNNLYGFDKDEYLTKLAKSHIAINTLDEAKISCVDTIEHITTNPELLGTFDIVLANPPFGSKIRSGSEEVRANYDLAYKWKLDKTTKRYVKTDVLQANTPPQILFLEICIKLLKENGRLGIVVPESLISNTAGYVVQYLLDNLHVDAVCGMPESLFKTSGKGGTHTKTCLLIAHKKAKDSQKIFMAEATWCGHDSRGNLIPHNDLPQILQNYLNPNSDMSSVLGHYVGYNQISNNILAPRYYDPKPYELINKLVDTHDIYLVQDLIDQGVLSFSTGDEVGKLAYGTGSIPFVRTSDISNWEIKLDAKQGVSEEIFESLKKKQDVQAKDILMVKDGTYLIGTCAFVSEYDTKMVYQSHLYKIRVNKPEVLSPYLLLAALSSEPVIQQIKAKRLTLDIIDSIGKRVNELLLPIPKDKVKRKYIEDMVEKSINERIEARELARKAKLEIVNM
ncbi:N-6 DNA methylase [uncultured Acinetobacter sp.]|uniref:N-6 DNA methylase n=1 Tax=uncultured Acinetobacter sp. TaxID=165433 RepID=UPI002602E1FE|nr:N-6 DNA methylase [uncultured Acinetobacter sp.]